jgi:cytochrome d ubiquinol oxidase subunit I
VFVVSVIGPYVANQAGWVAAEVGRQPWVVYGLLRTRDAVSVAVPAEQVLGSIVLFTFIYLALVVLWLVVMNEKIMHGPEDPEELAARPSGADLVGAAAARGVPGGVSLTETADGVEAGRPSLDGGAPAGGE